MGLLSAIQRRKFDLGDRQRQDRSSEVADPALQASLNDDETKSRTRLVDQLEAT